jgi:hypothetical protein
MSLPLKRVSEFSKCDYLIHLDFPSEREASILDDIQGTTPTILISSPYSSRMMVAMAHMGESRGTIFLISCG